MTLTASGTSCSFSARRRAVTMISPCGSVAGEATRALSMDTFLPMSCAPARSEEHTSELQSLMRNSYAVFCLKKKNRYRDLKRHIKTYNEPVVTTYSML